jgi:hypothetical protein
MDRLLSTMIERTRSRLDVPTVRTLFGSKGRPHRPGKELSPRQRALLVPAHRPVICPAHRPVKTFAAAFETVLPEIDDGRRHCSVLFSRQRRRRLGLRTITGVLEFPFGASHLPLDLGLLSLPSRSLATHSRLDAVEETSHPLERCARPAERLPASPHGLATRALRFDQSALALVGCLLALVGCLLALVGCLLALVGCLLALVGGTIPFVCTMRSLVKLPARLFRALSVRRHCFSVTFSHSSTRRTTALDNLLVDRPRHHPTRAKATHFGRRLPPWGSSSPPRPPGPLPLSITAETAAHGARGTWPHSSTAQSKSAIRAPSDFAPQAFGLCSSARAVIGLALRSRRPPPLGAFCSSPFPFLPRGRDARVGDENGARSYVWRWP